MAFSSILYQKPEDSIEQDEIAAPACFPDLHLDQIVAAITAGKKQYNLAPFFHSPLNSGEAVRYRQAVMQDMQDAELMDIIKSFAGRMGLIRRYLGRVGTLGDNHHRKGWFLEAALSYCHAVVELESELQSQELQSEGLRGFQDYLRAYLNSTEFQSLQAAAQGVKEDLAEVRYSLILHPGLFKVQKYNGEADYSLEVEEVFARFQGPDKQSRARLSEAAGMNHIEAKILEFVGRLYPEPFAALDRFCDQYRHFVDETLSSFDRQIQFYIAYLDYIADLKESGLPFCYPQVSASSRAVQASDSFDLALAQALAQRGEPVIRNDFALEEPERVIVVSGPNQGGKSTFARMFGQLHYLASLGCPVPGREAQLFLPDRIYAHFERAEDIRNLRGKLKDEMVRIHQIFEGATADSILLINEIFASTTLEDAVTLSKEIMARVSDLDLLCVWVSFIDELSTFNAKTISMVSTVEAGNPDQRTFKIIRQPADGLAHALTIAEKHGLTYEAIKGRLSS